jgi:dipeptidyl-peptidase-3
MMQLVHAGIVHVSSAGSQVTVSIDRKKLLSHGKTAVEKLLLEMHVCICTADLAGMRLYDRLSEVGEDLRGIQRMVMKEGIKQKQILQSSTFLADGVVHLREYTASPAGMLQSWAERGI